tara:strand:- start:331 stop:498 length:168 start_codon:yes stop_codon:yes gene_type:complete
MNFIAGFEYLFVLILIGFINYLLMLKRYKNDEKRRKMIQYQNISKLYPKNYFINT